MSELTAVLIDDETKLLQVLRMKLNSNCPDVNIVGTASNAEDGYEMINELNPDVVFLDIGMPGGSGFDMLRRFEKIRFELIFVTGYNEYALEAINFCAIGYVLKPINSEELIDAVNRAGSRAKMRITQNRYDYFLQQIKNPRNDNKRLGIPTDVGLEFVNSQEIVRCEAINRRTYVYLSDETKIESSYQLSNFFKLLSKYNFFLSHKSHLINVKHMIKYGKDGSIIMSDGSVVPLARRKKGEFGDIIDKLH